MALSAGTRLGPYEVIAPLGAGGMGEVYRALDRRLDREVAIKTLPDALMADPERRARFEREARALAALAHPSIATLHEIGEVDGRPYLVMELVEGPTLSQRLDSGRLPPGAALMLASQLADGLAAAHARGIVHRDLKPSNLAFTADGRLKILDFGLAKTGAGGANPGSDGARTPAPSADLTGSGMLVGTAGFMSPEQVRGQAVDVRADVWAFGCLLYELLTGERAFKGSSPWETVSAVMREDPDWSLLPPELPTRVDELLRRCLEKDPGRRLADLNEARLTLGGSSATAVTWVSVPARTRERARPSRRAWRWAAAVVLLLMLAAASAAAWWWRREPPAAVQPSIAILPFRNLGGGEEARWLGEGLSAAVSARLADFDGVRVFPAWSTLEAVAEGADAMKVAKLLGADMVLGATVQRVGGDVRVIFTLLEAPGGKQLAAGTVSASDGSLLAAQDELAGEVLAAIDVATPIPPADDSGLRTPEQQDRYLRALGLLQRYDRAASVDAAIVHLEALAKEVPSSSLVHAALGRAFLRRFTLTHDASWAPLARSYCERARQLSPHRPEVEVTLAQLAIATGDASRAIPLLRHALSVQPGNADALLALAQAWDATGDAASAEETYRRLIALQPGYWAAHSKLGVYYFRKGRFRDAAQLFQRVTELNPDSARGFSNLGGALQLAGDFEGAEAALRRSVAIESTGVGVSNLGTAQFYLGRFDEAAASFEEAARLMPSSSEVWLNLGDAYRWSKKHRGDERAAYQRAIALGRESLQVDSSNAVLRSHLVLALAKTGDLESAERELRQVLRASTGPEALYAAAIVAVLGGRQNDAVGLLQRAVAAGYDVRLLARDPELSKLRDAAGFAALLGGSQAA